MLPQIPIAWFYSPWPLANCMWRTTLPCLPLTHPLKLNGFCIYLLLLLQWSSSVQHPRQDSYLACLFTFDMISTSWITISNVNCGVYFLRVSRPFLRGIDGWWSFDLFFCLLPLYLDHQLEEYFHAHIHSLIKSNAYVVFQMGNTNPHCYYR